MSASTLARRNMAAFWLATVATGAGTGLAAAALTRLLEWVQRLVWGGTGRDILHAASEATPSRHLVALFGAGLLTGAGQLLLRRLSSGNGIDITAAIFLQSGRPYARWGLPLSRSSSSAWAPRSGARVPRSRPAP